MTNSNEKCKWCKSKNITFIISSEVKRIKGKWEALGGIYVCNKCGKVTVVTY